MRGERKRSTVRKERKHRREREKTTKTMEKPIEIKSKVSKNEDVRRVKIHKPEEPEPVDNEVIVKEEIVEKEVAGTAEDAEVDDGSLFFP